MGSNSSKYTRIFFFIFNIILFLMGCILYGLKKENDQERVIFQSFLVENGCKKIGHIKANNFTLNDQYQYKCLNGITYTRNYDYGL